MRCICCDVALSDFESTRKSSESGEYLDMCNKCFKTIDRDVNALARPDLFDDTEGDTSE